MLVTFRNIDYKYTLARPRQQHLLHNSNGRLAGVECYRFHATSDPIGIVETSDVSIICNTDYQLSAICVRKRNKTGGQVVALNRPFLELRVEVFSVCYSLVKLGRIHKDATFFDRCCLF